MTDVEDSTLKVAIIGGGLAGATLANALLQYPHLIVDVYESAPEFSERGAAIGFATNAIRSLELINTAMVKMLDDAGAVVMHSTRFLLGQGPGAGKMVRESDQRKTEKIVHRANFLKELLKPIPKDRLHANKKLVHIEYTDTCLQLDFADDSEVECDILIGADGIHSYVRKSIFGNHPAAEPKFAHFWDCRNLVPMEKAVEKLGTDIINIDEPRQYDWIGQDTFILHDHLNNGQTLQCVAAGYTEDEWSPTEWQRPLDSEHLTKMFSSWDHKVAKGMVELLLDQPEPKMYSQWEHPDTPSYAGGRIAIVGDAAHATTPWQGSGGGLAIEDALILSSVLGRANNIDEARAALEAYDKVRRPRAEKVIESSRGTGMINTGRAPGVGLDYEKVKESLKDRWKFIHNIDLEAHRQEAIEIMTAVILEDMEL